MSEKTEKSEPAPSGDEPAGATRKAAKPPKQERRGVGETMGPPVARLRTLIARVVWALCVLAAVVLAAGALCIALDANRDNSLVTFLLDRADDVDLGVFSRTNGIKEFGGENAELKNALFNWGLGAVAWLVIGRVLDKVVRP